MGRLPQFDRAACLDSAMAQFWRHGYAASSVDDLCRCTGLARASLYHAFGDKRGVLLDSLRRYAATSEAALAQFLRRPGSGREAIHALLDWSAVDTTAGEHPPGCFLLTMGSELRALDSEVAALVQAGLHELEHTLGLLLYRGIGDGSLPRHLDAATLARFLTGVLVALRTLARVGAAAPLSADLLTQSKRALDVGNK